MDISGVRNQQALSSNESDPNVPALCQQLQSQIDQVADDLKTLTSKQSLANDPKFLKQFHENASKLQQSLQQTINIR